MNTRKHLSQHEIEEDKINGYNWLKICFDVRTSLKEIDIRSAVWSWAFPMWVLEIVWLNRYLIDTFTWIMSQILK